MRGWDELIRTVQVPADVAGVVGTGRSQLLQCAARDMTKAEVAMLLELVGVYMDTNRALQSHCAVLNKVLDELRGNMVGINCKISQLLAISDFRNPDSEPDEDA